MVEETAYEDTFRGEAFRLVYPLHCLILGSLLALLTVGLHDDTFAPIAKVLLLPAIVESVLRVVLHHAARFRADRQLAQRLGARAMCVMTTVSWFAYFCIARVMEAGPAAGPLVSALVPVNMTLYPLMMTLFFLSPSQRVFVNAVSVAAIAAAPRWSCLRDRPPLEGEAAVHFLALGRSAAR